MPLFFEGSTLVRTLGRAALGLSLLSCGESPATEPPIVVTNASGRVVIERSPFTLRVENEAGQTVLALAATTRTVGDVLYAPLSLSVGDEEELRVPVLPGVPDTNPPIPAPARRFVVDSLLGASTEGDVTVLTLATTDPDGRTITLHVGPEGTESFLIRIDASGPSVSSVAVTFASSADEAFHGFGGRRESTDLHGKTIESWVLDYRFPDVTPAYYDVAPLVYSSRGYGLLLDQDEYAVFRLDTDLDDAFRLAVRSPAARLVITPREPARAIAALTAITGRHRIPPAWSLGPTISRAVWTGKTTLDYEQAIADDLDRIAQDALPVSAYCFEGWALLPEDVLLSTIATLQARDIHPLLYLRSLVGKDLAGTQPPVDYDEALAKGYVATTEAGDPYLSPSPFPGDMAVIDFTNPEAAAWWKSKVRAMLDQGADGFMNDFGEQVLPDMHFADGSTGFTMHNRYPVLQHRAAREAVDAFEADHPEREIFFFGRAGYTGRPGSAAYENAVFPGDELKDWSKTAGLRSIVPDMLNRAVTGAYGFTTDIAGYADFKFTGSTKELYVRWSEAAALTPFFRVHNGPLTGPQMPWSFDAETEAIWTDMAKLHQSVQPVLLAAWAEAVKTGMPVIRPLWLVDPGSSATSHNDDEWLVGADLLAAPVLTPGATTREVWLPAGCWQAHGEGAELAGGTTTTVDAPLGVLPWFQRCASP